MFFMREITRFASRLKLPGLASKSCSRCRTEVHPDGSFSLTSAGRGFGEAGFYFVVRNADGSVSSRYVRALRETIRVYAAEEAGVRADHVLKLWGMTFLRLHYRLRQKASAGY